MALSSLLSTTTTTTFFRRPQQLVCEPPATGTLAANLRTDASLRTLDAAVSELVSQRAIVEDLLDRRSSLQTRLERLDADPDQSSTAPAVRLERKIAKLDLKLDAAAAALQGPQRDVEAVTRTFLLNDDAADNMTFYSVDTPRSEAARLSSAIKESHGLSEDHMHEAQLLAIAYKKSTGATLNDTIAHIKSQAFAEKLEVAMAPMRRIRHEKLNERAQRKTIHDVAIPDILQNIVLHLDPTETIDVINALRSTKRSASSVSIFSTFDALARRHLQRKRHTIRDDIPVDSIPDNYLKALLETHGLSSENFPSHITMEESRRRNMGIIASVMRWIRGEHDDDDHFLWGIPHFVDVTPDIEAQYDRVLSLGIAALKDSNSTTNTRELNTHLPDSLLMTAATAASPTHLVELLHMHETGQLRFHFVHSPRHAFLVATRIARCRGIENVGMLIEYASRRQVLSALRRVVENAQGPEVVKLFANHIHTKWPSLALEVGIPEDHAHILNEPLTVKAYARIIQDFIDATGPGSLDD